VGSAFYQLIARETLPAWAADGSPRYAINVNVTGPGGAEVQGDQNWRVTSDFLRMSEGETSIMLKVSDTQFYVDVEVKDVDFRPAVLLLSGTYKREGDFHERPKFRTMIHPPYVIYYYDDRDGVAKRGWWIGKEDGSTQVWGHAPSDSPFPPESGWTIRDSEAIKDSGE
jgi:hypothetical protein